ncbi:unnamed protein product, partial [Darwinula stevensoni]
RTAILGTARILRRVLQNCEKASMRSGMWFIPPHISKMPAGAVEGDQVLGYDTDIEGFMNREEIYEFIAKQDLNYCRNPTSAEEPWCFVSTYSWDYCNIPFCLDRKEPVECRLTEEGWDYAGFRNVDAGGRNCQPWLTSDAKRFQLLNFFAFPDELKDYTYNYCRNPDPNNDSLWCFTEDGEDVGKGRGQCNVPFCYEVYERSALE